MEEAQFVALLVRRSVGGDAAAWEEIVQRYHRRIYNVCYRFAGDSDNAQDLTQEVFIKMYRTLNTYDAGKGAFMTWVTTITRNLLVDHFRKTKGDRITDSLDSAPSEHEDCAAAERADRGPRAVPDAAGAEPGDAGNGACGAAKAVSGAAGGGDFEGPAGHGLSGNCHGSEGSGGDRQVANKPGTSGTCAAPGTYI